MSEQLTTFTEAGHLNTTWNVIFSFIKLKARSF